MTVAAKAMPELTAVNSAVRRYDIGFGIDGDTASTIELEVVWPQAITQNAVFFCVPGGGMNRRFFDLGGDGNPGFSFARQMAAQGFISVLIDPPGIGGSDKPVDGHAITPERIATILTAVHAQIAADLREGNVSNELAPQPELLSIGVGHSMGAMLMALHQAHSADFDALVLLGFGTQGLPQFLPASAQALRDDPTALRKVLPQIAKAAFPQPYPVLHSDGGEAGLFGSTHVDPEGVKALKAANDVMLPVLATLSLFPGNVAPEIEQIRVPVYLALGERDLIREPEAVPAQFKASNNVELQILPRTGHSHFLFPAREQLFEGLAAWASQLAGQKS